MLNQHQFMCERLMREIKEKEILFTGCDMSNKFKELITFFFKIMNCLKIKY